VATLATVAEPGTLLLLVAGTAIFALGGRSRAGIGSPWRKQA
jgi:hypothetical protein